ncbi:MULTISPECIES: hypothetical protein [Streptomyces]|uniref:Uncharacterized protein n=2 Tax=Streptomyces rimosus subsp. rimosus TaxID=132474 RepID=L8EP97_STRR1|nr:MULTISPECIES: hypothetical protein [Streptomyces]KOG81912.1 hypothetical protein ADK78_03405 [Kitasatospora aureofaciens]MYT44136.1 hypothetical protein [Streptomyces sp. SID5471]KEF04762.1 hypothetical protein DF17_23030 [Streptomyces rimosus]KEF19840.1 hypothetical protein DF18_13345 [Streptomyces rimosus]KOT31294.1 hypothetical protein ADK42_28705 [Streptomyces rimosus subsp. rimosus]
MANFVECITDPSRAGELWCGEGTVAVFAARPQGDVEGSVALLDLGASDAALRFVAVLDCAEDELLVPLLREAADAVRQAGGTALRWITEEETSPGKAAVELGAMESGEVYRWWRRDLPAGVPVGDAAVRRLPAEEGREDAAFRIGTDEAWYNVELAGTRARLVHNREADSTADALTAITAGTLHALDTDHPGLRSAEVNASPDDEELHAALQRLGFTPTTERAVEYTLPLA